MACAVLVSPAGAHAAAKHAAMVVDANTGRVLYARAADAPRFPASLTKIMTLYMVFELMQQGRLGTATRIRMSANAAAAAPSKLGLDEGAEIALIDAIKVLITKSANDVAVAVAEHIAGTEERFALLMTQKAQALGMNATVFKNAHGLPHPQQVTTARDMITLALHLIDDFPRYYALFATRSFTYGGDTYRNHNTLLGRFEGVDGIKTGYIKASGFNLVSSVRRDGKHVVGVVFGGATARARNAHMRTLLSRALAQASTRKTRQSAPVAEVPPLPKRGRRESTAPQAATGGPRIDLARVRRVPVSPHTRSMEPAAEQVKFTANAARLGPDAPAVASGQQGRGAAPSSLEAQAWRISRGEAPVAAAVLVESGHGSPQAAPRLSSSEPIGAFAIQVGAFGSEAEAQRQLQTALDRSDGLLDGRLPTTQPVRLAGRQLYRARFSGFDAQTATLACQQLKRRQIDCLVARP